MLTSNTKLTKDEKSHLRDLKANMPRVGLMDNEQTTVAFRESINTVEFTLSVASPAECKFRRKVGQLWALSRFMDGETVKMAKADFYAWIDAMGFESR